MVLKYEKLVASKYFILQVIANIFTWSHLEPRYSLLQTTFCLGNDTPKYLLDTSLLRETCQSHKSWNSNHITRQNLNVKTSDTGQAPKTNECSRYTKCVCDMCLKKEQRQKQSCFRHQGTKFTVYNCLRLATNNTCR